MEACPYSSRASVKPSMFANRQEALRLFNDFLLALKNGYSAGFAIVGEKGYGKTSLLRKLSSLVPEDILSVKLFFDRNMSLEDFVFYLIDRLEIEHNAHVLLKKAILQKIRLFPRKVLTEGKITVNLTGFKLSVRDRAHTPLVALELALDKLYNSGTKCVLIQIDDAENLSEPILRLLRNIADRGRPTVGVVLAGEEEMLRNIIATHETFLRLFSGFIVKLQPFSLEDTIEALEKPLRGTGLRWNREAAMLIYKLSKGVPYNVILMAEEAFRYRREEVIFDTYVIQRSYVSSAKSMISDHTLIFTNNVRLTEEDQTKPLVDIGCELVGGNGLYKLKRVLGEGGFSRVYLAEERRTGREVVVKIVRFFGDGQDDLRVNAMKGQAKVLRTLSHENIIRYLDEIDLKDSYAIVTEYLPYPTLESLFHGNPATESTAVNLVTILAKAVHYLHSNGIIHGDIKPSDLISHPTRQIIMTDFGVAGLLFSGSSAGTITPGWSAPELIDTPQLTPSVDIYSIGAVLFFLLTGKKPTTYDSAKSLAALNPGVSDEIRRITQICMETDPKKRFSDISEVIFTLESIRSVRCLA